MGVEAYKAVRNTVDVVVLTTSDVEAEDVRRNSHKKLQIMLINRDTDPYNNMWTLPGGFVGHDKTLQECVDSTLKRKTGLDEIYTEQLFTYGDDINRDPRDRVITIAYIALLNKQYVRISSDKDNETDWFWVEAERNSNGVIKNVKFTRESTGETVTELGFDHSRIITDALNRLANKIMYTDIGFNLVNKEFTIKELESAYEVVSGRKIPGFRRVIIDKLVETDKTTTDIRDKPDYFRPARLYKKKD